MQISSCGVKQTVKLTLCIRRSEPEKKGILKVFQLLGTLNVPWAAAGQYKYRTQQQSAK